VASSGKHRINSASPKKAGNFFKPAKRFCSTSFAGYDEAVPRRLFSVILKYLSEHRAYRASWLGELRQKRKETLTNTIRASKEIARSILSWQLGRTDWQCENKRRWGIFSCKSK
jgi:hypothetical protein